MTDNRETIEMLKMLKEQALKSHNDTAVLEVKIDSFNFVLNEAIKALDQQTCEDAISRQAVLETIEDCNSDGLKGIFCSYNDGKKFEEYIKALPSVTPKKKTGEWEVCEVVAFGDFKGTEKYKCSECGEKVGVFKSNFCPNCGARMVSK